MGKIKKGVNSKTKLAVTAYPGDRKTLLAWDLPQAKAKGLAGFTIEARPKGKDPFFLLNQLRFEHPEVHVQDKKEPAESSLNSPFHRFRWVHVPGQFHGGPKPFYGEYAYVITPRYFDASNHLLALDPTASVKVTIDVGICSSKKLEVGFTRGYVQSQAFVNHFGIDAKIRPAGDDLQFDLKAVAGKNAKGDTFTYEDEYEWLGSTAREKVLGLLDDVIAKTSQCVDVFAYDLDSPDVVERMLKLAKAGRIRVILDSSKDHYHPEDPEPEDRFQTLFEKAAKKGAEIQRGKFARFAHEKIFIVRDKTGPVKVLTGSTNFSVTGMYVNSNHVLVFDDPIVATKYADVFDAAWADKVLAPPFKKRELAKEPFAHSSAATPKIEVTFAPHPKAFAQMVFDGIVKRLDGEKQQGSVFFAVMQLTPGSGNLLPTLQGLHADPNVFSFGISDQPGGIFLYKPIEPTGILVTGKPGERRLPPPFSQVPAPDNHQIHHKFVVCGFNSKAPVVYCGSSNLALLAEQENGDNLLAIYDAEVVTAFTIEAVLLVDHFQFLDGLNKDPAPHAPLASAPVGAATKEWFLSVSDRWVEPFYRAGDLRSRDRELFR